MLDHARRSHSAKRGGHVVKLSLGEFDVGYLGPDARLLALNEALAKLEELDPRAAKVVELRFFGGLGEAEGGGGARHLGRHAEAGLGFRQNVAGRPTRVSGLNFLLLPR